MNTDVIIVGGGASGTFLSILLKEKNLNVLVIESKNAICKKLLSTGNGRCNISNSNIDKEDKDLFYHSYNKDFEKNIIKKYSVSKTVDKFKFLGLPITELKNGKLYPLNLQSSSVIDVLRTNIKEKGVDLLLDSTVKSIKKEGSFYNIEVLIKTTNDGNVTYKTEFFKSKYVVLSTGGNPIKSSDEGGYNIAKSLGHKITSITPGIVQMLLKYPFLQRVSGAKFDAKASLFSNGSLLREDFGEVLFTDYGISGPPILQLSRLVGISSKSDKLSLHLDIMPNLTIEYLEDYLFAYFAMYENRTVFDALNGLLNKKIIIELLYILNFNKDRVLSSLDYKDIKRIVLNIKNLKFEVSGTKDFSSAQVTVGGIDTSFIDNNTLMSKINENLYFTGEIIDVDGDCGGLNLQWAWSSAFAVCDSISL